MCDKLLTCTPAVLLAECIPHLLLGRLCDGWHPSGCCSWQSFSYGATAGTPLLVKALGLALLFLCRCNWLSSLASCHYADRQRWAVHIPHCLQDIRPKAGGPPTGPKLLKRDQLPTVKYEGKLPTTQIDPK